MPAEDLRVFVVDDEESMLEWLGVLLDQKGYQVECFSEPEEALKSARRDPPDILLVDIKMPGMSGLELFSGVKETQPDVIGIVMTAFSSVDTAVKAIRQGASDYLIKPFEVDQLSVSLERALCHKEMENENLKLRKQVHRRYDFESIIGSSEAILQMLEQIRMVADKKSTVLITGESGTGKELVARALHYNSSRSEGPFLGVNCGSFTRDLLASELFGHVKGSFTGAHKDKEGLLVAASGGTFFLDEVSELHRDLQVKLLRTLQERQVLPVGGTSPKSFDVRLVAATNRDLHKKVEDGDFRADLYYRLNVIPIHVPPLRKHRTDIPVLVERFIAENCSRHGIDAKKMDEQAMAALTRYDWPGNVRELENVVERLCVMTRASRITRDDIPDHILENAATEEPAASEDNTSSEAPAAQPTLREMEKAYTYYILEHKAGGQKRMAAKILGIDESTLHRRLERYRSEEEGD
ncbi:response regulator [Candidatus Fermentibacteria bacterium]|nr:response regulator [Candidatus Fermentibacteria bacterium]